MVEKKDVLDIAKKTLIEEDFNFFSKCMDENRMNSIRNIAEQNHTRAKEELFKSAKQEKCDPVIVSNFKYADELFSIVMEYFLQEFDKDMAK